MQINEDQSDFADNPLSLFWFLCARWLTALLWLWLFAMCCAYYNVSKVALTWAWASHNNESKASLNTYFIAFSFEVRSRKKKQPIRTCIKVQQYTIKSVCFFVNAYGLFYFTLFFTLFRRTISRPGCQKQRWWCDCVSLVKLIALMWILFVLHVFVSFFAASQWNHCIQAMF